jgi:hypothetical protein
MTAPQFVYHVIIIEGGSSSLTRGSLGLGEEPAVCCL